MIKRKQGCFSKRVDFYKNMMPECIKLNNNDYSNWKGIGSSRILRKYPLSYPSFEEEKIR